MLKLYYQSTKIQPVAGDGRSSTKVVLRTKIQQVAGDGGSSTKVVLCHNEYERLAPKPCKTTRVQNNDRASRAMFVNKFRGKEAFFPRLQVFAAGAQGATVPWAARRDLVVQVPYHDPTA